MAQSDGTTTQYFAYDGLGSVRQLVDATGSVGLAQTFDPYGNGYARAGSVASSLGYTGEQTDSNGFVFLRARYYQPGMGRFTQMDPSRQEQNPYQYALSNPVLHTDPTGLVVGPPYCPIWDLWCQQHTTDNQSGSLNLKINLQLPASFLVLNGCSGGSQSDIKDFLEGVSEQILLDMVGIPVSTAIEATATIPGIGEQAFDFLWSERMDMASFDVKLWTGSDAYRLGRQAGQYIARGIGMYVMAAGIATALAAVTIAIPTGLLAAACEGATGFLCTPVAAGVVVADVVIVGVGAATALYGGIIYAAAAGPVGGKGAPTPSKKAALKKVGLPTSGRIRFVPPEEWTASQPLRRGLQNGYLDRFMNEWVKGPSRTPGEPFEWDVQLSRTGKEQLGWLSSDGGHLNVSLAGEITH